MTRSHSTVCSITKIARATTKQPVPNTAWCRFPFNCAEIKRATPAKTSSAERITLAIFIRCNPVGTGEQLHLRFILNVIRPPNVPTLAAGWLSDGAYCGDRFFINSSIAAAMVARSW